MIQKNLARLLGLVAIVVAVIAIVLGVKYARQAKELRVQIEDLKKNPQQITQDEVKQLTEQVGKLIVLPEGENPTLATITDREKLKDVPFFTKAENGDKVLIYVNARKAILYRPSTGKIIEVATINLSPNAAQNFAPKIALRNGTDITGLTKKVEDALKRALPNASVVVRDNAKKTDYAQTLVVDLTGKRNADAQRLASVFNGKVGDLPKDETKPADAEFLVIIGKDLSTITTPSGTPAPSGSPPSTPTPSPSPSAQP